MLDYATLSQVWVLDRRSLGEVDLSAVTPLSRGVTLPASLGDGPATASVPGIEAEIAEERGGTRIRATTARVQIDVLAERPAGHEAMGVVVPWNDRRFQYTVKDVARPARGTITIDGIAHELPADESWATLDHGRGRWPYRMNWHWGAASGRQHGRTVGVQLGGLWTDGTGSTENALSLDGRVHKLGGELEWRFDADHWLRPWSITGDRVDLRFEPFHDRVLEDRARRHPLRDAPVLRHVPGRGDRRLRRGDRRRGAHRVGRVRAPALVALSRARAARRAAPRRPTRIARSTCAVRRRPPSAR